MVSTSHSYAALKSRLDRVFNGGQNSPPGFLTYTQSDVVSRLKQRLTEISVFEFTRIIAESYHKTGVLPADEVAMNCNGVLIDINQRIRLAPVKFLKLLIECLVYWCYALMMILIALRPPRMSRRVTLLYGVSPNDILVNGSDARFINFCREGPIFPLASANHLLIQASQRIDSTEPDRVRYGRNPLILALQKSGLNFSAWMYAVGQHFWAIICFARATFVCPPLILLGKDVACHAAVVGLNRDSNIKDVIFTTSNYMSQPLWFWALAQRSYSSHIVWYSQNVYPISYADEDKATPFPSLHFVRADVQWVWSKRFQDFLMGLCPECSYRVVGPIVWYVRSRAVKGISNKKRIALFDVTPLNEEAELKLGLLRNFYSEKNVTTFIRDVVEVTQAVSQEIGEEIEIVLKHKRRHHNIHSSVYIRTIACLANEGAIKLIDPCSNLYDVVYGSDLVIACPYSSPVFIGKDAGKEVCWYDPTSILDWKLGELEFPLVQTRESLASTIRKALR